MLLFIFLSGGEHVVLQSKPSLVNTNRVSSFTLIERRAETSLCHDPPEQEPTELEDSDENQKSICVPDET